MSITLVGEESQTLNLSLDPAFGQVIESGDITIRLAATGQVLSMINAVEEGSTLLDLSQITDGNFVSI